MAPTATPTQHAPYWKRLLWWGVGLDLLSGVLAVIAANQATDDVSQSSDSGGLIIFAFLIGGVGAVLLVPGMIGWGIDAAGLAVRVPPRVMGPAATPTVPPAPQGPPSPPMFTRFCGTCGAGVSATDTHCWKCHKPL